MKDPKFREAYNNPCVETLVSELFVKVRVKKGWTQAVLARKMGTKQSAIARWEEENSVITLKNLEKLAKVAGMKLKITLSPKGQRER